MEEKKQDSDMKEIGNLESLAGVLNESNETFSKSHGRFLELVNEEGLIPAQIVLQLFCDDNPLQ